MCMKRSVCSLVLLALLVSACPAAESVNLLSMGDWGNNGDGQRRVAATLKQYITAASPRQFSAMLLAGDNFYIHLDNIFDAKWKTMFEEMYEPAVFDFPFYPSLGNHDYQENRYLIELAYA